MYQNLKQIRGSIEHRMVAPTDRQRFEQLKSELIEQLPRIQAQTDSNPELKEDLIRTEYLISSIDTYVRKGLKDDEVKTEY